MEKTIKTKKNDLIELEFTGIVKDTGQIFDTNIQSEAEKLNPTIDKKTIKPLTIYIGQGSVVPGLDKELEGKEIGKSYEIEVSASDAFGQRRPELVKLIPLSAFREHNIQPQPGMTLALDNTLVKIITVSGGRIMADLNNPLAGKDIVYKFKIKKKIEKKLDVDKEKTKEEKNEKKEEKIEKKQAK